MKIKNTRSLALASLIVSLCFGAASRVAAQTKLNCPIVNMTGPASVTSGQKMIVTAGVEGGDPKVTPKYNWTVSAGTIESGQGTSVIGVNTKGLKGDSTVTVTLEVGGFDRSCLTTASTTTRIEKKAETRKFDEYGALKQEEENERLDNFLIELMNDPQTKGYIIAYQGRTGPAGQARRAAEMMKSYLVDTRHFEPERTLVVDGGAREKTTFELWIVPVGAVAPPLTPIK
jgi:hypothetical protein